MVLVSTFRRALAAAIACMAMACTAPMTGPGPDRATGSNASAITWQDGKPAYAITCSMPGGCQKRANQICDHGSYTTLRSENMPTAGSVRSVAGMPSVVIRCG
jgi:hypothetical protein